MPKPLRVLLIEDSERDAALLKLYLKRGGYDATVERIETAEDMTAKLAGGDWDVIVSDVNLPRFGARAALDVVQASGKKVPVIVVSGEVDPAVIDDLLRAG